MHLGIDPGLRGALALVSDSCGALQWASTMPIMAVGKKHEIDERTLHERICFARDTAGGGLVAHVEKVGAMPKQGVTSMFSFGAGWGLVRGILCGLSIPYDLITPQQWQKTMLAGMPRGSELNVARRLWPTFSFVMPGGRKDHEGAVDAALIAEAGRRLWKGGGE